MFVLAHVSDPHLAPLPPPRPLDLVSKRLLGYVNWLRKRRSIHRIETLDAVVADLKAQAPDHIAVTGDLVNIALSEEFIAADAWLAALGPASDVTVIPGNHDAYVRSMRHAPLRHWASYMNGQGAEDDSYFPFVRRFGAIALVGVSSAVPTAPLLATGKVGAAQLARLRDVLTRLGGERAFRIVLIHHPPETDPGKGFDRLVDAPAFRQVVAAAGAELVLHGHKHFHTVAWLDGQGRRVPAVGVPSASAAPGHGDEPAGYNLYRIDGGPGAWRCEMVARGFADGAGILELGRRVLVRGQHAARANP